MFHCTLPLLFYTSTCFHVAIIRTFVTIGNRLFDPYSLASHTQHTPVCDIYVSLTTTAFHFRFTTTFPRYRQTARKAREDAKWLELTIATLLPHRPDRRVHSLKTPRTRRDLPPIVPIVPTASPQLESPTRKISLSQQLAIRTEAACHHPPQPHVRRNA